MMKKNFCCTLFFLFFSICLFAQDVPRTNCNQCWNADSLGNHRAVVEFNRTGKITKVTIPWRRRDDHPEQKRIIVEDAKTHQRILNVRTFVLNGEFGVIAFEPISGSGNYYVYYMPYKNEGTANYPKSVYLNPKIRLLKNG